jgi:CheY-like chemotaxis protein
MAVATTYPTDVLVVDDDPDFRDLLKALLTNAGYRVAVADDGEAAIQRLCDPGVTPDLILLDLVMPGMDGFQLRRIQQQYLRWAAIPVVVLSAFASSDRIAAMNVASVLTKPIDPVELLAVVERCRRSRPGIA